MAKKFKSLSRSTKFIVEFHNGVHSTYTTKNEIIRMKASRSSSMSLALINALDALESVRKDEFEKTGAAASVNAIGHVIDVHNKMHTFTLDLAAHRIGG